MPLALTILLGCQLLGEVLREALHLPLPGPVVGMFLLAAWLVLSGQGRTEDTDTPSPLNQVATSLIANMGLLFVPAGVGVIAEVPLLRQNWLALLAGVLVSTILSLVVTGVVMQVVSRAVEARRQAVRLTPGRTVAAGHPERL
jgi:putative effector of murein hydrolase LrgA (UPF0299 family)